MGGYNEATTDRTIAQGVADGAAVSGRMSKAQRARLLETSPTKLDNTIEILIGIMLAFMPLALGVIAAWSELVVFVLAGAIAACLVLKAVTQRNAGDVRPVVWTWAYAPIVVFLVVVITQLLPLPANVVRLLSPETLSTKSDLLADAPGGGALVRHTTLSFYPFAAQQSLRVVLVASLLFMAVVSTVQRTVQIRRMLTVMAAVAGAIGLLALLQDLTASDKIFWTIPTHPGIGARGGPFVNRNHFVQFMNLGIGASLGLLLISLREHNAWPLSPAELMDYLRDGEARRLWWLIGAILIGAVTIILSLSRGGMVSMVIAAGLTAVAISRRWKTQQLGWWLVLAGLFVFSVVLYAGLDAVIDRLATIRQEANPSEGRLRIYKDVAATWRQFPLFGLGLGTWQHTYPMFDRSTNPNAAEYADSDWAQALFELGAVGLAPVIAFVVVILVQMFRAMRARHPVCAGSFGLGYGLLAVIIGSFSDFGQHMPAVAGMTAVTCGLIVCMGRKAKAEAVQSRRDVPRPPSDSDLAAAEGVTAEPLSRPARLLGVLGRLAMPVALAAAVGWALVNVEAARAAEANSVPAANIAADLAARGWDGSDDEYTDLLRHMSAAAEAQPANVEHLYWLNTYRWRAISRDVDPETGEVLLTSDAIEFTERIVDQLHRGRSLCPTFGPVYSFAGQLEAEVLGRIEEGARHVRVGYALAPNHPDVCFAAGTMDLVEGKWEASLDKYRRCIQLNPSMLMDVYASYVSSGRPDLALEIAGDDVSRLQRLAAMLRGKQHPDVLAKADEAFLRLLESEKERAAAPAGILVVAANLHRDRGERAKAITLYRLALDKEYTQTDWRLELARCLAAEGRVDEALREARRCLQLRPNLAGAVELTNELDRRNRFRMPTVPPDR